MPPQSELKRNVGSPTPTTIPGGHVITTAETQQRLWAVLSQAAGMRPDRPIAFFCAGARCWQSYNAALRAEQMGFKMVLWYRGGLAAWQVAGCR